MPQIPMCNVDLINEFIQYGSPMNQVFAIQALEYYAKYVRDNQDLIRVDVGAFINPDAWIECANRWNDLRMQRDAGII